MGRKGWSYVPYLSPGTIPRPHKFEVTWRMLAIPGAGATRALLDYGGQTCTKSHSTLADNCCTLTTRQLLGTFFLVFVIEVLLVDLVCVFSPH